MHMEKIMLVFICNTLIQFYSRDSNLGIITGHWIEDRYLDGYELLKSANSVLIQLYWNMGKEVCERQERYNWGKVEKKLID